MFPALQRVFEAAECRTQVELAVFLGIRQSSVADSKKRQSIPAEWLIKLLQQKGINPDWVRTGQGDKLMRMTESSAVAPPLSTTIIEYRPVHECTTDELLMELVRRALKR